MQYFEKGLWSVILFYNMSTIVNVNTLLQYSRLELARVREELNMNYMRDGHDQTEGK